ncbi:hypothetical protein CBM2609_B30268 [Cupriavidus taiwanensis]|nr:hypothetical protein CBM2604_B40267 [Cupriavidus taiwanensis]SOZ32588.1 hypothetical protein CBM2609_B30268 [Cupriavidus taiwanensis]SOZ48186.1 hypothetical protein CBM2610_B30267 [Cupriavidus taiwanensis]
MRRLANPFRPVPDAPKKLRILIAMPTEKAKTRAITETTVIGRRNPLFVDGWSLRRPSPNARARLVPLWRAGRGSRQAGRASAAARAI